ncbi:MAG: MarR family transcriptional regulator [Ruminococcaceae bacterium]|nr:MarR family transcriptional regulator [Oscillospiraceae bacterium]
MNKKQNDILTDYMLHSALHFITLQEQYLRRVCEKDLSLRELHVLEAVASLEPARRNTMAEVARYLHLSPASLTTSANVLVKKGYLTREYSPEDRRVIYVELTEIGREANRKYLGFVRELVEYIGKDLDETAADSALAALLKVNEYLESQEKAEL